jgi:hypothetical protein
MKKIITLVFLFIVCIITAQAKVWRVNNNPSLSKDVLEATTLFDNVNNATNPEAAAGDSVYFEPSSSVYAGFTVTKANITIIGYGYFLNENTGLQANTNNSKVSSIEFGALSTGSSVWGVEVTSVLYITASNITVTRCFLSTVYMYNFAVNATGIRIDKSFITSSLTESSIQPAVTNITLSVENCIFSSNSQGASTGGFSVGQKVRGLFRNNTLNQASQMFCYNFYVANNIFLGNTNFGNVTQSGNNVYKNNLLAYAANTQNAFVTNTIPSTGNLFAVNMTPVFTGTTDNVYNAGTNTYNNFINLTGFTQEGRFILKTTANAALAGGETGTTFGGAPVITPDCGAYGATDPYRKAGIPPIPTIYALTVPATVPNGAASMNISISSRSNN